MFFFSEMNEYDYVLVISHLKMIQSHLSENKNNHKHAQTHSQSGMWNENEIYGMSNILCIWKNDGFFFLIWLIAWIKLLDYKNH